MKDMVLLDNIQFTRKGINRLYELGMKYKWYGPEAPIPLRWIYYVLRPTSFGKKHEQMISDTMKQFHREFLNLQRRSLIPPAYWDTMILNRFEEYVINQQVFTVEQCIKLYESEKQERLKPEGWEQFYLKRVKMSGPIT